jgi:uncharacterized surface protein with fasciclin (FAS1) repeats
MQLSSKFSGPIVRFATASVAAGLLTLGGCASSHKEMAQPSAAPAMDIVDTAVSAGSFNTLVAAVKQAGLVETLKSKGPFTVFAPTDAAFAKIPKNQLDAILADKATLTKILTYHVVPGKVMAADVKPGPVKTAQGRNLTVERGNTRHRQRHRPAIALSGDTASRMFSLAAPAWPEHNGAGAKPTRLAFYG